MLKAVDWHKLSNDENIVRALRSTPLRLISKTIPAEQWNYFDYADEYSDGFDGFDKVWNKLSKHIGDYMVVFSELEAEIESEIHQLISDSSDHLGLIITRDMNYGQKYKLYIDLLRNLLNIEVVGARKQDVTSLGKHLLSASKIRNVIAHAKWPSVDKNGYVFSRVPAIHSSDYSPQLKYYRLGVPFLKEAFSYCSAVVNMPYYIREKYIENK